MSQEITPKLEEIFTALRTALPHVDIMMGDYVMDSWVPTVDSNGLFKPYILCKVHTAYETTDNGICEKSEDPLQGSFSLYIVSPDGWVTQQIADTVRVTLRGRRFTDTDYLVASGGYSFGDADLGYTRYAQNVGFTFRYNLGG